MKQKFISFFLIVLMSMVGAKAYAYDIAVENADGITIYYNYINDGKELEVTYGSDDEPGVYVNYDYYKDNVVIPEEATYMGRTRKVTSIGKRAFCKSNKLTSVTIPNSVTSIEKEVFYGCYGLTSLIISNSVTSIGKKAFHGCYGLTSFIIPNSVSSIGEGAFKDCSGLTSVSIPNSVTTIGNEAFYNCRRLTSVTIPNSVTSIEDYTFMSCSRLTSVTIPNSVTSIGKCAFYECSSLTSVTIPNSVTSIGESAFAYCSSLTLVTIPNSVTTIGRCAFDGWDIPVVISLTENTFAIAGKAIDDRTFSLNTFNNATLYVPVGTIDKYKSTGGWKDFVYIEEGTSGGGSTSKKCEKPTISYNNGKLTFTSGTEGTTCQYDIIDTDIKAGSGNEVQLTVTYNISVYATKSGYEDSETVKATLCWIDVNPKTEGIESAIANVRANPVLIQSNGGVMNISGINDGTEIVVYSVSGQMVGTSKAVNNQASVFTNIKKGEIAIVKIGDKSIKVVMQ
jgi:hypothetical protein